MLDVVYGENKDGTNVCQWKYYGQKNQIWVFEPCKESQNTNTSNQNIGNQNISNTTTANYKFSDSGFTGLGTLTNSIRVNGLSIAATKEKMVSIRSCNSSYNGKNYTKYLALGGAGNDRYRSVAFAVNGHCTITVTAKSSGSSTRYLAVCDAKGNQLTKLECSSSLGVKKYTYTGTAGTLYLCSTNSGINLYEIDIK